MKKIIPLLILAITALIVALLMLLKPKPNEVAPERPRAHVEILRVKPENVRLEVRSQGTILPRIESSLAVEVSGRIIEMSENFRAGARFSSGDILFKIDPADYQATSAARAADLANARLNLAQEVALAEQAAADWEALGDGEASPLTLRAPQLKQAEARVASAEAALEKADRDLNRTEIRAPYDGYVLSKSVDLGQYVIANPTSPVAIVYATDIAEVRLPLSLREASFLDQPSEGSSPASIRSTSTLEAATWAGQFVRFEATVDPSSRLVYAVVEIEKAFEGTPERPALRRGLFVEGIIEGKTIEDAVVLPRYALRGSDTVYLKTEEETLVTRTVRIAQSDDEKVIISDGLRAGEAVVTSPIAYYVENMPVEVITEK